MQCRQQRQGYTLVEIMIVVAIVGLLAAIAVPAFSRLRKASQNVAFINDLRVATAAFETSAMTTGMFPPDCTPSQMPAGMSPYLVKMNWRGKTPIGGQWDWDYLQFGGKTGVSVFFGNLNQDVRMADIDKRIDDGNLATGLFQKRDRGYIYIIEQR